MKSPIRITCPVNSEDARMFESIINQGIDAHLGAFTELTSFIDGGNYGSRLVLDFDVSELPLLVRRLEDLGTEQADLWADDIRALPEFKRIKKSGGAK